MTDHSEPVYCPILNETLACYDCYWWFAGECHWLLEEKKKMVKINGLKLILVFIPLFLVNCIGKLAEIIDTLSRRTADILCNWIMK